MLCAKLANLPHFLPLFHYNSGDKWSCLSGLYNKSRKSELSYYIHYKHKLLKQRFNFILNEACSLMYLQLS